MLKINTTNGTFEIHQNEKHISFRSENLIVRGVTYTVSMHAYKTDSGEWILATDYQRVYIRRPDRMYGKDDPTPPARKTILDIVQSVLVDYVKANSLAITLAVKTAIEYRITKSQERIEELFKEAEEEQNKLNLEKIALAKWIHDNFGDRV